MSHYSLKQLFEETSGHIKIDRRLISTIESLRKDFLNKNADHLSFFGGNLLGAHTIRYLPSDKDDWLESVIETDEYDIKDQLKRIDAIDPSWVRANDVVNLSSIWILYKIYNEKRLSSKDKETGLTETCLLLQYKFLSSIMYRYFPYPSDISIAIATYETLNLKFEIKQYASWQRLLEHRTRMILNPKGIHFKTYSEMDDDGDVINMISDVQQRLREVVKKYTSVFNRVKDQKLRIKSKTNVIIDGDGSKSLAFLSRPHTDYVNYLKDVIGDKPTFIRKEIVTIITEVMHTMTEQHLYQALVYCSDNFGYGGDKTIEVLVDETLLHAYQWLHDNVGTMANPGDLSVLVVKLKNLYNASRMVDPQLIKIKTLSEKIIDRSVNSRNRSALASVRTGLVTYIAIRAFAKNYYQG